jgi:hypothetical protein
MDIFFQRDPWEEPKQSRVNFASYEADLGESWPETGYEEDITTFQCRFTYPLSMLVPIHVSRFPNQNIIGPTKEFATEKLYWCKVPENVSVILPLSEISSDTPAEVRLDLIASNGSVLISGIRVHRLPELDRRRFNYTACTMIANLEENILNDWLVYNSLLGVEHFYLFDNSRKRSSNHILLKPYLQANLVTLIFYPFASVGFWGNIQRSTFQVAIQKYGVYTEWMSFYDIDEFFDPSPDMIPANKDYSKTIPNMINSLWGKQDSVPAIMFDTQEMGCSDEQLSYISHAAVASHCTVTGVRFAEYTNGHGKMFVRPNKVRMLTTPHRYNDYNTVWATSNHGGLFKHFNGFRYSKQINPSFSRGVDTSLRDFVLCVVESVFNLSSIIIGEKK